MVLLCLSAVSFLFAGTADVPIVRNLEARLVGNSSSRPIDPNTESHDQAPQGLAKDDWQSIRAAYEAARHAFQPVEDGWQARNPGQQWITNFDGRGFIARPSQGSWTWGLELQSYGFGTEQRKVGRVQQVKEDGQRLSYQWDDTLQEWWVNDQRGLEHGFTLAKRPIAGGRADGGGQRLTFLLSTRGSLTPVISSEGRGVVFKDATDAAVLTYSGLKVWDADGKELVSSFELAGEQTVRLWVDDHQTRYPLTIDPIAQQAYLKASNTGAGDLFGYSVAVDGDTVVVGAIAEDSSTTGVNSTPNNAAPNSGAAYVFVRNGTTWTQQAYLKASNTGAGDEFGQSVAVSGDTIVVGAWLEDSSSTGVNSAPNDAASRAGAAYVFVRNDTTWSQQAYLKPSNVSAIDEFGFRVAVDGDTIVVGAIGEDSSTAGVNGAHNENTSNSGAAYVFVRISGIWSQQAFLKASNPGTDDDFGISVALDGETAVVGSWNEDSSTTGVNSSSNELASNSGAAYVFVRIGSTWSQQAYLKAGNTGAGDLFGISVAVHQDTIVVGAPYEDSSTFDVNSTPDEEAPSAGAAYIFMRDGFTWTQQAYLKASNTAQQSELGRSVAVKGGTVVVGAPYEDTGPFNSGAAYVYVKVGALWVPQAFLKPGNPGTDDLFGFRLALSGETLVVGAWQENSSSIGVNSSPDENANDAGAAYIFTGIGPAPRINLLGNNSQIPNGSFSPAPSNHTAFGNVPVFGGSTTRTFTIVNSGTQALQVTGHPRIVLGGLHAADFNVIVQPDASVAPLGGSTSFQVTFDPTAAGLRSATISIATDAENDNPYVFGIEGTGMSIAEVWAAANGVPSNLSVLGADGQANLLHFAFGTNPASSSRPIVEFQGNVITPGSIRTQVLGSQVFAELVRRKDYLNAGLAYTLRFSADLVNWHDDTRNPTIVADDGTHQVVRLSYPVLPGDVQSRFFQVRVTLSP